MARVLAISSHVVRGTVGLAATVPALQWLGHEVWALPTVLLASRPGLGRFVRHEVPAADLAAMLAGLEADGCWVSLDAVLTGYFPSPQAVGAAAEAIGRVRQARPHIPVLVDPILGDAGRLYVAEETAAAIRDRLLPLASIATPNRFELEWLTGAQPKSPDDVARATRQMGLQTVVVTSAWETEQEVATLMVSGSGCIELTAPKRRDIANGAGDLFAGLLLGRLLSRQTAEASLEASLSDLDRVLAASEGQAVLQLSALAASDP
jgi:pyridoxine kinase